MFFFFTGLTLFSELMKCIMCFEINEKSSPINLALNFTHFNFYNLEKLTGNKNISDEKLKADFNLAAISSPIGFFKCVDTWMSDFREDLPKIDVPSLIIQGDADKILPFKVTGEILAQKLAAELRVIEGGSHGIPWTHADEIAEEILSFMHRSHERIPAVNLSHEREANQLQ